MCRAPVASASNAPWVPFPTPGGPSRIKTTDTPEARSAGASLRRRSPSAVGPLPGSHVPLPTPHLHPALLHEAVVVAQQQQLLDLLDGVQADAYHDEEAGATEEKG